MTFPEKLRSLRKEKGFTQQKLADMVGTTKQAISAYEKGNTTPYGTTMAKIAQAFNVTVEQLTNENESVKNFMTNASEPPVEYSQKNAAFKINSVVIKFVTADKQTDYINAIMKREPIPMPGFPVPFPVINPDLHTAFQIGDDSMQQGDRDLPKMPMGTIVVGKKLQRGISLKPYLKKGFVVVTKEGIIFLKLIECNENTHIAKGSPTTIGYDAHEFKYSDVLEVYLITSISTPI